MPQYAAIRRASHRAPTRAFALPVIAGVDSQTGNYHEDMAAPRVNGDPFAGAGRAVIAEGIGWNRRDQQARAVQHKGGGAGAVVTFAFKGSMTAAVNIRAAHDVIACGNRPLHRLRGVHRHHGASVPKNGRPAIDELILIRRRRGLAAYKKKREAQSKGWRKEAHEIVWLS